MILALNTITVQGQNKSSWCEETETVEYAGPPLQFTIPPRWWTLFVKRYAQCYVTPQRLVATEGPFTHAIRIQAT